MGKRQQIDFLGTESCGSKSVMHEFNSPSRKSFLTWSRIAPTLITLILLVGLAYTTKAVVSSGDLAQQFGNASIYQQIKHLASSGNKPLLGEEENRINILLLGIAGVNHDGGQLTDTIIVASIDPSNKKIGLLSIPRDLVAPIPGVGWQKINSAHAYGLALKPDDPKAGAALAKATIQNITDLPIHYYVKLDFEGFEKIVDALGGIRVNIPNAFTDYDYPDNNFGYEQVSFDSGWQNLSGSDALKYVRSRHGNNGEGTDFARARRQQQILEALQARTLALSTLLNPNKLISLADIIGTHLETDMELWQLARLYEIIKETDRKNITQIVLSTEKNGLLVSDTNEEGTYLLRPRAGHGNFSEIAAAAHGLLGAIPLEKILETSKSSRLKIAIQNGTLIEGLAAKTAQKLKAQLYNITQITNAKKRDYEKTVIYNLSDAPIGDDIQILHETLNANIAPNMPSFINAPDVDILIIVGRDMSS